VLIPGFHRDAYRSGYVRLGIIAVIAIHAGWWQVSSPQSDHFMPIRGGVPARARHGDTNLNIPVVRAQHLIHHIGVLRDAGVPVERELEPSRLPVSIEQAPNDYVSFPRALDWVWRASREVGIMELGFLAGRRMSIGTLHPDLQRALIGAPTGFARVAAMSNHMYRENSSQRIDTRREGGNVRVICEIRRLPETNIPNGAGFSSAFAKRRRAHSLSMCALPRQRRRARRQVRRYV
jgi:hypothetical protein